MLQTPLKCAPFSLKKPGFVKAGQLRKTQASSLSGNLGACMTTSTELEFSKKLEAYQYSKKSNFKWTASFTKPIWVLQNSRLVRTQV